MTGWNGQTGSAMHRFTILLALLATSCSGAFKDSQKQASAFELCNRAVSNDLVAPATYKVVWQGYEDRGPLTINDFKAATLQSIEQQEEDFKSLTEIERITLAYQKTLLKDDNKMANDFAMSPGAQEKTTGFVVTEYDAQNRMGVPLRAFAYCRVSGLEDDKRFRYVALYDALPRREGEHLRNLITAR